MTENARSWTVLVYMAGDNGAVLEGMQGERRLFAPMEAAGYEDLKEMQAVGSTDGVAILAQFDTLSEEQHSYRAYIPSAGGELRFHKIPETNMGDSAALRDFVIWGMNKCPAERYAVVLWNHGTGWKEDDIYAFARTRNMQLSKAEDEIRSVLAPQGKLASPLFLSAAVQIVSLQDNEVRGICYDDSSMDFLDNAELSRAFQEVESQTGQKVHLIGMDACLMSMLEVAYQLRDHGEVLVGSQEVEPMQGWPYAKVFRALLEKPEISVREFAAHIVTAYGESFGSSRGGRARITQSAIDLPQVAPVAKVLQGVASRLHRALVDGDIYVERALFRATRKVVRFKDEDFVDLYDLLTLIRDTYTGDDQELNDTLDRAIHLLDDEVESPVLANVTGPGLERARGISIYLPVRGYSPFYNNLAFAELGWGKLVHTLNQVE